MGSIRKRKHRQEDRVQVSVQLPGYDRVLERCGEAWNEAFLELAKAEVTFDEFAAPGFDCSTCPNFLVCLLSGRID